MQKINRISILILSLLTIILVGSNIFKYLSIRNIDTVPAVYTTVYDDIESFGVFKRQENIVLNDTTQNIHINVSSGERVSKGQNIALSYVQSKYISISEQLSDYKKDKEIINSVTSQNTNLYDSKNTAILINNSIADLNQNIKNNDLSTISSAIENIKLTALKGAFSTMDTSDIANYKKEIDNTVKSLEAQLKNNVSYIKSVESGNFIVGVDGYEDIQDITVSFINSLKNKNIVLEQSGDKIGKTLPKFEWEFFCVVSKEEAEKIKSANRIRLVFDSIPNKEITVKISSQTVENDDVILGFKGTFLSQELLEMRTSDVSVVLRTYDGIKIPKEAVRIRDDKLGVYCLSGSRAIFKEIEPIFEKDNYYIINANNNSDIINGDKIITSSIELNQNQVVK